MDCIGIDVHKMSSQICIQSEQGKLVERRIKTERQTLKEFFERRTKARIVLEASTESEWVARCLEGCGHEAIVADPNFAPMYATRSRKVKTDRRDARALCEACRLGAYRKAHRKSDESRQRTRQLQVREALVRTRARYVSLVRALLRQEGLRVKSSGIESFASKVKQLEMDDELQATLWPMLSMLEQLSEQIRKLDQGLKKQTADEPTAARLQSVPGVGPITALSFVSLVDEVSRFASAKELRAYIGLVPREYSSGEKQGRGRITKTGNKRLRWLLVEAAWCILRLRKAETEPLRQWTMGIQKRRGKQIAVVALARKLAGILYAMWRDGTSYQAEPGVLAKQAA